MELKKLTINFTVLLAFVLFFIFFGAPKTYAATLQLSGSVKTSTGTPVSGATIEIKDPDTNGLITDTTSNSSGTYTLILNDGTYNIEVTPPSGSNYGPAIARNYAISSDTTINFILAPAGTIIFNGHVYSPSGAPLINQEVSLIGGSQLQSITNAIGDYSIQVSPDTYMLQIIGTYNNSNIVLQVPNNSLSQSTVLDITYPLKKVHVSVKDQSNNPVNNVRVQPNQQTQYQLPIGGGLSGSGTSTYPGNSGPQTNASGNVDLWLFPTYLNTPYTFTAIPPNGSPYISTTLSNISFTADTDITITMQQPVTLSGHIYDPLGNPVANQEVSLIDSSSTTKQTTTDASGNYSLQVSPNTYMLQIIGTNNLSANAPQSYVLQVPNYSLTENTSLDITIPAKKVIVHVQNTSGNPVNNVELHTSQTTEYGLPVGNNLTGSGTSTYGIGTAGPHTDSSGNATLWLYPTSLNASYTFTAIPPSGSIYLSTDMSNIEFTDDTNITVTMQQPVTLSGHVSDSYGNELQDMQINLVSSSNHQTQTTTNNSGNYSVQVSPDTYFLQVIGTYDNSADIVLTVPYYPITQDTVANITVPLKKVTVHIQDAQNNPVNSVKVQPSHTQVSNLSVGITGSGYGGSSPSGTSTYTESNAPTTDVSGNVTLWLFPTNESNPYSITATPANGSIYAPFVSHDVVITGDQTEVISLQYSHNPPVTTATLSPDPFADETYPDPVTVTLEATPTSGYTIEHTYYKTDNGLQQTYTTPFTVSNSGEHTISYWSGDNSGVIENHKTKTFIIHQNQSPVISNLSDVSIATGGTYVASGSFADSDSTTWSATVDYGDGGGAEILVLDENNFSLSHVYQNAGEYTVTVQVHDGDGGVGTETAIVTVIVPTATPTPTNTPMPTETPTPTMTPTSTPTPTPTIRQITTLSPAKVWVGLPNFFDVGTRFDLKAEVYKDNTLISSGQVNSVSAGLGIGGFTSARLDTIPFTAFSSVDFPVGSQLKMKLSVRNACSGSLRNSGTARLWLNDSQANSQFGATIGTNTNDYFLRDGFVLATTAGNGPKKTIDVQSGAKCSTFKSFGTWSISL